MRHFLAILTLSTLSLPAFAQVGTVPLQQPNTMQPAPGAPTAPINPAPKAEKPVLEEIGFDPKVKRDPYGRIIEENKQTERPKTETEKLRRDTGNTLRSDRKLFNSRSTNPAAQATTPPANSEIPLQNAVGAQIITPDGRPVTVDTAPPPPRNTTPPKTFTPITGQ